MTETKRTTPGVRQRHRDTCKRTGSCRCPWQWSYNGGRDKGTGQRLQLSGTAATRKDAIAAKAEVMRQREAGMLDGDRTITVGQYLEDWYRRRTVDAETPLRASTAKSYRDHLDRFWLPLIGRIRLRDLRAGDIERAMDTIRRGHPTMGPTSRARVFGTLRSAMRSAVRRKVLPVSPTDAVDRGGKPVKRQVKPWSPETLGAFLDDERVRSHRLYPAYVLAAYSGLRRGEVCGLQWQDVDLDEGTLTVERQRVSVNYAVTESDPKTENGLREVPLVPEVVAALKAWRVQQKAERLLLGEAWPSDEPAWVFTDALGQPWHPVSLSQQFRRLVQKTGLPYIRLHDLRHGTASLLLNSGVANLFTVSRILGHSDISVTSDVYGHMDPKRAAEAMAAAALRVPRKAGGQAG